VTNVAVEYVTQSLPSLIGTKLGPYEILTKLGAGGMGEVYKALDTRLDRTVAVKTPPPLVPASPEFRERFERGARAISQLDQPNTGPRFPARHDGRPRFRQIVQLQGTTPAPSHPSGPQQRGRAPDPNPLAAVHPMGPAAPHHRVRPHVEPAGSRIGPGRAPESAHPHSPAPRTPRP